MDQQEVIEIGLNDQETTTTSSPRKHHIGRSFSYDAIRTHQKKEKRQANGTQVITRTRSRSYIKSNDGHHQRMRLRRKDSVRNSLSAALDQIITTQEDDDDLRNKSDKPLSTKSMPSDPDDMVSRTTLMTTQCLPASGNPLRRSRSMDGLHNTGIYDGDFFGADIESEIFGSSAKKNHIKDEQLSSGKENGHDALDSQFESFHSMAPSHQRHPVTPPTPPKPKALREFHASDFPQNQTGDDEIVFVSTLLSPEPIKPTSCPDVKIAHDDQKSGEASPAMERPKSSSAVLTDDWGMCELPISPVGRTSVKKRLGRSVARTQSNELSSMSSHENYYGYGDTSASGGLSSSTSSSRKVSRRYSCGATFSDFERMKQAPKQRQRDSKMPEELGYATVISGGDTARGHRKTKSRGGGSLGGSSKGSEGAKPDYGYGDGEPDSAARAKEKPSGGRFRRRFSNKSSTSSGPDYGYGDAKPDSAARSKGKGGRFVRRFSNTGLSKSAHTPTATSLGYEPAVPDSKGETDYGYGSAAPDVASKTDNNGYGYGDAPPDDKYAKKSGRRPSLVSGVVRAVQRRRSSVGGSGPDPVVTKASGKTKEEKKTAKKERKEAKKEKKEAKKEAKKMKKEKKKEEDPLEAWKNPDVNPEEVAGDDNKQPKRRFKRRNSSAASDYLKEMDG